MTIFLILGAVAGLYVLALLFRLASYALPVYAGLTCAFLLLGHDVGHLGAILGGLAAGIATLLIGQGLIAFIRSPMIRVGIACLFAIPAGFAGFQAAHALGSLATDNSMLLAILGYIAAMATETYGSARWATDKEIRKAGLLKQDGVVIGSHKNRYLRHNGPEHILCFAPTRSGKGVGLVIPSLLAWPGSCIVHDIKGENWDLTAGFRARHGRVLLFDPTNPASNPYNPLLEVRKGDWEVRDAQNIADILIDPEGSLEKRTHWEKTSHSLLVGTILHVLYAEKDKSLAGVAGFLSDPRRSIETTLHRMKTTPHLGKDGVHPVVAAAAQELLNKSDNERSGRVPVVIAPPAPADKGKAGDGFARALPEFGDGADGRIARRSPIPGCA